ncbi:hypothetical protein N474_00370 [Pseudoalteromonas luteoviolacea CPMOR-2]|uniref:Helix-hairpin-helix DNA-binding motif class 1 domain-containing protein n=1 Tax=Pseudoalteromonas luteoviolacea DSM 6061 TaxID=1365250 RepID=A0A166WQ40_9GAMM|nr:ComEA family DNA-binding protein [Pseudoalteromonas luteoviolacea]KZN37741.1 hypothetical protein N475_02695 [Pseudoalteromonas luteoviolacea DSM 6061]KZN60668.1 hypothetical protein N474_00370 [Pseudoalteromonas luteoviolacea CPMOR-2]MBE0386834.1 competence protein ComEA [Pseudoalteromonas luteoviolacea DSM 6061]
MLFKNIWGLGLILIAVAFLNVVQAQSETELTATNIVININTASVEQLVTLPGIGLAKAQAIVANREASGRFDDLTSLTRVKGVGDGIVEKIKQHVVFD